MRDAPAVTGYLDRLTYRAGDPLTVYATGDPQTAAVRLVRLGRGPVPGRELSAAVSEVLWDAAGSYEVEPQSSCVGSFATVELDGAFDSGAGLTVGVDLWTTVAAGAAAQTLIELRASDGAALIVELQDRKVALRVDGRLVAETEPIVADRSWTAVVARLVGDTAELQVVAHDPLYGGATTVTTELGEPFSATDPRFTVAAREPADLALADGYARGRADAHYTGKLANPFVSNGKASLPAGAQDAASIGRAVAAAGGATWSLAPRDAGSQRFLCPAGVGPASPLVLVNLPNQGVTGPEWDGSSVSFRERPEHYAAAHFHSTDIVDAGWSPLVGAPLPATMESGVYGVELRAADGGTDTIPFFLAAPPTLPRRAKVAYLMPTFSYLAYANEDLIGHFQGMPGHRFNDRETLAKARARQVHQSREFGASLYDEHPDGSGVHYSTALRPILDMRAEYAFWSYPEEAGRGFSGDLYLVEWLHWFGYEFDVVTDEQLHLQGSSCLDGYDVVLTGSHPEYPSAEMLDALDAYRDQGGSLCYLGGNGFYWVTGVVNAVAPVVETRRGNAGVRSWDSPPGEIDLVSSWEPGGLWRYRGRAPQKLFGVGMAAAGGLSRPFRMTADTTVREAAPWFFEGLEGELIGDVGFVRGAAAGDEIDRVDAALGTPPGTLVLASSWDHEEGAQRATEEILQTFPGSTNGPNDPEIHADMVYFDTPAGGSVFATGSIAYFGALLVDDGDNNASRALRNVLDHMLD